MIVPFVECQVIRYYDGRHPLLIDGKGDPARGEWKPWENEKKKGKRKR